jgi:flagellar basal body L-ring protein FlgH
MSFSCSTDEQETSNTDCNCGEVIQSTSFNVVNGQGGVNVFSVIKIKNNCTAEVIQTQRNGNIVVGSQICDY